MDQNPIRGKIIRLYPKSCYSSDVNGSRNCFTLFYRADSANREYAFADASAGACVRACVRLVVWRHYRVYTAVSAVYTFWDAAYAEWSRNGV